MNPSAAFTPRRKSLRDPRTGRFAGLESLLQASLDRIAAERANAERASRFFAAMDARQARMDAVQLGKAV